MANERYVCPIHTAPMSGILWHDVSTERAFREVRESVVDIIIRGQEPADVVAVGRILAQPGVVPGTLQVPYTPLASRQESASVFSPDLHRLVAEVDGQVVGTIGLGVNPRPRRRHAADLGMAVDEAFQGQGIGSALLAAAVDLADRWLNIHRIELTVMSANAHAIRLYERHGFAIEGRLRDFSFTDGAYADAFTMARLRLNRGEQTDD